MGEILAQKTIREIALQVINRSGEYSMDDVERLIQIGIEGYTDMNYYDMQSSLSKARKEVTDSLAINLPANFIRDIVVSVMVGGQLTPLWKDDLNTYSDIECGEEHPALNLNEVDWLNRVRNGYDVGANFGKNGDYAYKYTIDYKKRQMFFNRMVPGGEVYIDYIGTGISNDGNTYIPIEASTPLRNYIMWQMAYLDPRIGVSEKQRREDVYERSLAKMRFAQNMMTAQEYRDQHYKSLMQIPKR